MKTIMSLLIAISLNCYSQSKPTEILGFKGEHYVFYNKCKSIVTFCELTQQTYTFCGAVKNCDGLYVQPGDTFYVNIEDKNQLEEISADISFSGYFPPVSNFSFQPVVNCVPPQALQIVIPLSAVPGSSFQIISQNTAYVNSPGSLAGVPEPYNIYIGGQQPALTFALADYTNCPEPTDVSVKEINNLKNSVIVYPNPSNDKLNFIISNFQNNLSFNLVDLHGRILKKGLIEKNDTELFIQDLDNGIYSISIYTEGNLVKTTKIIISSSSN